MADHDTQYDALPEAMKPFITRQEFRWLSDEEKLNLQAQMTEPDAEEAF